MLGGGKLEFAKEAKFGEEVEEAGARDGGSCRDGSPPVARVPVFQC